MSPIVNPYTGGNGSASAVSSLVAGNGVVLSPSNGLGNVTVSAGLVPTQKSAAYTAAANDLVVMTGGFAVTAPAAPVNGTTFGVFAANAATPVTINITLDGVAQTSVNVPIECYAAFEYDGTTWRVVSGNAYVWSTPTMQNSWTTSVTLQYTKDRMGIVHLRGQAVGGATGTVACTLPAGFRPGISDTYFMLTSGAASGAYVVIYTNGNVVPYIPTAGYAMILAGLSFLAEN